MSAKDKLNEIETLIREGHSRDAQQHLTKLINSKLDRAICSHVARLLWRAGMPDAGLRLLHPFVRPPERRPTKASDEEKLEYAICLIRTGMTDEGIKLLSELETPVERAWLYEAFAHFTRWEYDRALPLLNRYCSRSDIEPYDLIVGQVNLAAALVHEREYLKAEFLLRELIHKTHLNRYRLLLGNSLALATANFIFQKQYGKARELIAKAEVLSREIASRDAFFIQKWTALVEFAESEGSSKAEVALNAVREKAFEIKHWETVRDCDRHKAIIKGDKALLLHVYFGTPFPKFRKRLIEDFPMDILIPPQYSWELNGENGQEISLLISTDSGNQAQLKHGQLIHRLLLALASDFYRPQKTSLLFAKLFPGEFHHPSSSQRRVHEIIRRTRLWLGDNFPMLSIREDHGNYKLSATSPCKLLVPSHIWIEPERSVELEKLNDHFGIKDFSSNQAVALLQQPARSVQRILEQAVKEGLLIRIGRARATRYQFKEPWKENESTPNKRLRHSH